MQLSHVHDASGATVVRLAGELDAGTVTRVRDYLEPVLRPGRLVLDLRDVTFLDCAGIETLVRTHERVRKRGGWLELSEVPQHVRWLLVVTGTEALLDAEGRSTEDAPRTASG
jgi:anti-anti-sigma factor